MKRSESPVILFFRSITLLAFLIGVPGIAICWNHLPKDLWQSALKKDETLTSPKTSGESAKSAFAVVPELGAPVSRVAETSLPELKLSRLPEAESAAFPAGALPIVPAKTIPPVQQVSWERPAHDFTSLEQRLNLLGATHYQLQKWGNRGELFHFSCTVAPSEPLAYEKYFQAIGADMDTVMRSVIAEIEQWKNGR